MPWATILHLVR